MKHIASALLAVDAITIVGILAAVIVFALVVALVVTINKKKSQKATDESREEVQAEEPLQKELPQEEPAEEIEEQIAEEAEIAEPVTEEPTEAVPAIPVEEEIAPAAQAEPLPEPEPEPVPPVNPAEELIARKIIFVPKNRLISVRYDKSMTARLMQTSAQNKAYYSELKNELLSYSRVKARMSWKQESFRRGRELYAKLAMRGKTLCLYLALNPADYVESKYLVEDVSDAKKNEFTPCMYRIKNDRRLRYAKELIAEMFAATDAKKKETEQVDYAADFPYEATEPLLERGLIKLIEVRGEWTEEDEALASGELNVEVPRELSAAVADTLMKDEIAEVLVRESMNVSVRGKQTIVNVDTLNEYFDEGETVTLEEMRARIPFLNKSATYVKVLARGVITKPLNVEADDFSLQAVKMIVLAGGAVYRKQRN